MLQYHCQYAGGVRPVVDLETTRFESTCLIKNHVTSQEPEMTTMILACKA